MSIIKICCKCSEPPPLLSVCRSPVLYLLCNSAFDINTMIPYVSFISSIHPVMDTNLYLTTRQNDTDVINPYCSHIIFASLWCIEAFFFLSCHWQTLSANYSTRVVFFFGERWRKKITRKIGIICYLLVILSRMSMEWSEWQIPNISAIFLFSEICCAWLSVLCRPSYFFAHKLEQQFAHTKFYPQSYFGHEKHSI